MKRVEIESYVFLCDNVVEEWRARTAFDKEPGTIELINTMLQPGEIFYDIGANVGIYTIIAAHHVGSSGHVYAFEPHVGSAATLLRNVEANKFQERVTVLTIALGGPESGFYRSFNYHNLMSGTSGSQSDHRISENDVEFVPQAQELKRTEALYRLVMQQAIRCPQVVKLDVDGNELDILRGIFEGGVPIFPRLLQVETRPRDRERVIHYMSIQGYRLKGRHWTHNGRQSIQQGADPEMLPDNSIFELVNKEAA